MNYPWRFVSVGGSKSSGGKGLFIPLRAGALASIFCLAAGSEKQFKIIQRLKMELEGVEDWLRVFLLRFLSHSAAFTGHIEYGCGTAE